MSDSETIVSSEEAAGMWSGALKQSLDASLLDLPGVDDDNTLAESGVYNTAHGLLASFASMRDALNADADNIWNACRAYEEADAMVSSLLEKVGR